MILRVVFIVTITLATLHLLRVGRYATWPWAWTLSPLLVGAILGLALKVLRVLLTIATSLVVLFGLCWFWWYYLPHHH